VKKLTCKDVGGACDEVLFGETLDALGEMAKKHAMAVNDDAHKQKMSEMMARTPEERAVFWQEMVAKFDAAPGME
jgi:hypothetical protein